MKIAIVFLSKVLNDNIVRFSTKICNECNIDTFIVLGDEIPDVDFISFKKPFVINISNDLCVKNGYVGSNITGSTHIENKIISYDKFLLHFCLLDTSYDFVLAIEDDVFIPSVDTIKNFIGKYHDNDLVTARHTLKSYDALDWHWPHIVTKIGPPYYSSIMGALGVSRKMLSCIRTYISENKGFFHTEAAFNTIADHNSLKISTAPELKTIVWRGNWWLDLFLLMPNNFFHPVKLVSTHDSLRSLISYAMDINYEPNKEHLPQYLKEELD